MPQLEVLVAHKGMQGIGERTRKLHNADQLLNVGKIPQSMWRRHTGRELELEQPRQRQQGDACAVLRGGCWIWKRYWLRLSITWIFARQHDVDVDVVFC